ALLVLWLLWPQDPVYKGKSLGYWLDQVDGRFATPAAQVAFNQMGENAVPALFQRVRNEDALPQRIYSWTWSHLPEALQEKISAPDPGGRALHNRVAVALSLTGSPAAPALVKALEDSDGRVRLVATGAVGMMGARSEVPIPVLVRLLH